MAYPDLTPTERLLNLLNSLGCGLLLIAGAIFALALVLWVKL